MLSGTCLVLILMLIFATLSSADKETNPTSEFKIVCDCQELEEKPPANDYDRIFGETSNCKCGLVHVVNYPTETIKLKVGSSIEPEIPWGDPEESQLPALPIETPGTELGLYRQFANFVSGTKTWIRRYCKEVKKRYYT